MARDSLRQASGLKGSLAAAGVIVALVVGIFGVSQMETAIDAVLHAEQRLAGSFQSSNSGDPAGYGASPVPQVHAVSAKGTLPELSNPSHVAPVKPSVAQDASRDNAVYGRLPASPAAGS